MAYTRVNWEDLPSTNTPINATNLNKMDKGIKDNYDEIQTKATLEDIQDNLVNVSNEVDEDYRVNFIVQDNLFVGTIEQGSINAEGVPSGSISRIRIKEFINVQPDTAYQIKTTPTNTTLQLFVFEYTNSEVFVQRQPADWIDARNYVFKTSNTTGKIKIAFRYANNSNLLPSAITSLEVKENIPPSIYVDNEEIYSKPICGSNNNGSYIKYPDGTMICFGAISKTLNITGTYTNSYYATTSITFPENFVENPIINLTPLSTSDLISNTIYNITSSQVNFFVFSNKSLSNANVIINYIAIGKWNTTNSNSTRSIPVEEPEENSR